MVEVNFLNKFDEIVDTVEQIFLVVVVLGLLEQEIHDFDDLSSRGGQLLLFVT